METSDRQPMKLRPYVTEAVWGGDRLAREYGIDPQGRANTAEAWALSAHPRGSSTVETGPFAGQTLGQLFAARPELFGSRCAGKERFPIIVKLIDAKDDLSLQVHPRDGDPVLRPGEAGKTECWYILEAPPGALLYLGFREAITRAQFAAAIENKTIMSYVEPFGVEAGDFYFIPAGTLHAIGEGVLLAEVQQSSDTTYRVYDYNRLQNGAPRPLHIEQARAVTDLLPYEPARQKWGLFGSKRLCECDYFTVEERDARFGFSEEAEDESFVHLLILEAAGDAKLEWDDLELPIAKGDSILVPAGAGKFSVDGEVRALVTSV
ncbi:MAG: class I mannose-6-phosphate isomerase [Oscillospiraceae bacterium]|nr:class I mannose-6-phosphate isomerase [Oscillospiraceae bacterium]MCL1952230.1 class I mannose-6-phosphate isomerase [Oscillospiraceae bacterium]